MIAEIAADLKAEAADKLYDYIVPDDTPEIRVGTHVSVPFGRGNRQVDGYVMRLKPSSKLGSELKTISAVYDERAFDEQMLVLINRMREKYLAGYYDIIRTIAPAAFRSVSVKTRNMMRLALGSYEAEEYIRSAKSPKRAAVVEFLLCNGFAAPDDICAFMKCSRSLLRAMEKDGIIETFKREVVRDPLKNSKHDIPPELTSEQTAVLERIYAAMDAGRFEEFLLHGVTGSGKTEVYLQAIRHALDAGKQAIMLVPEISLTPQTLKRFTARFGDKVAVYHSGLSIGERYDEWRMMQDGRKSVVVGARSAVFAPFSEIGVIIIDESHSENYKSEAFVRYDAREIAVMRARLSNIPVISASATPTVSDYRRAREGRSTLLEMKTRVNQNALPEIITVDMRDELAAGNRSMFSGVLKEEIQKNLDNNEQTILFLNRRGHSTFVSCRMCGFTARCPNCSITLTYHRATSRLKCHYCGYEQPDYKVCPSCGSKYIRYFGGGTQKVEEEAARLFAGASILRMDIDTTSGKFGHEKILEQFEREKTDILIGTQMVAKGLDFENVTLVGVISADTMLNVDDYRSGERTFAMLEQVSGRAGRGGKTGRAVIQTYSPNAAAVVFAETHDYHALYESEISMRRAMYYPPYCEIVGVMFSADDAETAREAAVKFAAHMKTAKGAELLGPIPAPVPKIQNRYRWQLMIKTPRADRLNELLLDARKECQRGAAGKSLSVIIDKDPNRL